MLGDGGSVKKRRKGLALVMACLLLLNGMPFAGEAYALAPAPGTREAAVRRDAEILDYLMRGRLIFAETPEDEHFLKELKHADALLLSHGKVLVAKELKKDPLRLIRKIVHEEVEAIMQIMAKEDRARYSDLINMVLSDASVYEAYRKLPGNTDLPTELLANHMVATAFELLTLKTYNLAKENEFSRDESEFLSAIEPMVSASKHNYFTGEFWDPAVRELKIRVAMANGLKFYQVASTAVPAPESLDMAVYGVLAGKFKERAVSTEQIRVEVNASRAGDPADFTAVEGALERLMGLGAVQMTKREPIKKYMAAKEPPPGFVKKAPSEAVEVTPARISGVKDAGKASVASLAATEPETFAFQAQLWRRKKGWNQARVAELLGKTSAWVSQIETGRFVPSAQIQAEIAAFYERYGVVTNFQPQPAHGSDPDSLGPEQREDGPKTFASRLREARKKKDLTQADLAEMIGMTQASISQWEKGKSEPPEDMKSRIAGILGVSPEELTGTDVSNVEEHDARVGDSGPEREDPSAPSGPQDDRGTGPQDDKGTEPQGDVIPRFGARLSAARKAAQLTQTEFASRIGSKQAAISQWETGRIEPTEEMKIKIAGVFNVTPEQFMGASEAIEKVKDSTTRTRETEGVTKEEVRVAAKTAQQAKVHRRTELTPEEQGILAALKAKMQASLHKYNKFFEKFIVATLLGDDQAKEAATKDLLSESRKGYMSQEQVDAYNLILDELARIQAGRERGDGFIAQGQKSQKVFGDKLSEIKKNDITEKYRPRIIALLKNFIEKRGNELGREKAPLEKFLDDLTRFKIYGFDGIVVEKEDFFFGTSDVYDREIFLATDVISELEKKGPPSLPDEYLLHEILCPMLRHYPAIKAQQGYFGEAHYPDRALLTAQTDEKLYKGLLGQALRDIIDSRRGASSAKKEGEIRPAPEVITQTQPKRAEKAPDIIVPAKSRVPAAHVPAPKWGVESYYDDKAPGRITPFYERLVEQLDAAVAEVQDAMLAISAEPGKGLDPVSEARESVAAVNAVIRVLGDVRTELSRGKKAPKAVLADVKWLWERSDACAKAFAGVSGEAFRDTGERIATIKRFDRIRALSGEILEREKKPVKKGGSKIAPKAKSVPTTKPAEPASPVAMPQGAANMFSGGKFDPEHPLVRSGQIIEVNDYKNIEGADLVAYAEKMRASRGVKRLYFDLDLTVFRSKGYLSSSKWFEKVIKVFGKEQTLIWWGNMGHEARQIANGMFYRLMDEKIPELISHLRKEGFEVIALTARAPEKDAPRTKEILRRLGIELDDMIFTEGADKKGAEVDRYEDEHDNGEKVPALFIEDAFKNLETVIKDRAHISGIYYEPPTANTEDNWDHREYKEKADEAMREGNAAHAFEYYFNAVVKILELPDGMTREQAYNELNDIYGKLLPMAAAKPAGYDKLLQIVEIARDGRSYLFHDEEARKLREKVMARGEKDMKAAVERTGTTDSSSLRRIEITMPAGATEEETAFTSSLSGIESLAQVEFADAAGAVTTGTDALSKSAQSLILYADDILENVMAADVENTLKNILAKRNILDGGKIVLFARNEAKAGILEKIIKRAAPGIETVKVTPEDLKNGHDEIKEAEALLRLAKARGAGEVLGIIKGPSADLEELAGFAKGAKVPIVLVGPEKGIYSFARAIAMLMSARADNGANGWLIMLPPIRTFTDEMRKQYEEYQRALEALVAA